ncbi:uncharacterized protein LOC110973311 [Acanthaster planci]|uniref:Uncharacterized protein LOC110973311 n=1 Tax=Acanthaster planci TaxID=133434 RepID=A0A8B7XFZ6_ACAPL|nr:uncharacterized protein LOC110973311 [Acanthaster planci]
MAATAKVLPLLAIMFTSCSFKIVFCQIVNPVVNTTVGRIMGTSYSGPNDTVSLTMYKGIPYAEPPVGPLRFSKPKPKEPWQGVLNASQYGPICPQPLRKYSENLTQSEDCLTLNLFVPAVNLSSEAGPFAVMVWIHGGGFQFGTGSLTDGAVLAVRGRVIVVTFNYRLGVLGFLSTGDDSAPGNYGLWDQRLAIQWVKEHIGNFSGDTENITIFGESAGAISVALQTVTPINDRHLFQRAILESGTANNLFTLSPDVATSRSRRLGDMLRCEAADQTQLLIKCLRSVSMEEIIGVFFDLKIFEFSPFYPTIDGEFLTDLVPYLLATGISAQYDYIVGINSDEGTLFLSLGDFPELLDPYEMSSLIGKFVGSICECNNQGELAETATFFYTAGTDPTDHRRNLGIVLDVARDALFLAPANQVSRNHHQSSNTFNQSTNTFTYYFTYLSEVENNPFPPGLIDGAGHAWEIDFVFGKYLVTDPGSLSASLSESVIKYWSNFAKSGDPNGDGLPMWPEFNTENETYIILEPNITTGQYLKADKVAFWNDYLPANVIPSDPNSCSFKAPEKGGTVDKSETKTVEIKNGDYTLGYVVGSLKVADKAMGGQEIAQFLGIPYAKPPVGDLRFKPPRDTGSWGDEPLGIPEKLPPACPQDVAGDPWMVRLGFNQTSENCLTLNIYAPTTSKDLPVVVFVHPGFGIGGTSSIYDAILLSSKIKAIVVVINYRLGALGFLTTGDKVAPGNYGLHDVLAALQWVNRYIGSFGGNKQRITVIGYGTGAELCHFLVLSERAKGLFQRVVLMSSTAISFPVDNQIQPNAIQKTKALAEALDCPTSNNEKMINCLREKPSTEFVLHTQNPQFGRAFPVVVDNDILQDSPMNLLKAGKVNDVDLIVGMTSDEDAQQSFRFLPSNLSYCPTTDEIKLIIQQVSLLSFYNPETVSVALATEYLGKGGFDDICQTRGSFRQFMQDYLSVWSTLETAKLHANTGHSVYVYSYDYEPLKHYNSLLPEQAGPSYADDLQFLFGDPYSSLADELQLSYRLRDKQMSLEVMILFKNFIHDGYPGKSLSGVEWSVFDSDSLKFLTLDPCPDIHSGLDNDWDHTLRFWTDLMPIVTVPPKPTTPVVTAAPEPCVVGENIGLNLSIDEASTLIQALIGLSVGLLCIILFFVGGCVAYRARAVKLESAFAGGGGIQNVKGTYAMGEKGTKMGTDNFVATENYSDSLNEDTKDQYHEEMDDSSFESF